MNWATSFAIIGTVWGVAWPLCLVFGDDGLRKTRCRMDAVEGRVRGLELWRKEHSSSASEVKSD